MSERKYNFKKNNENTNDFFNYYAEGVEKDNRPAWLKYVSVAAGGIAASTMKLVKNRKLVPSVQAGSNVVSSSVITNKTTTEITTISDDITTSEAVTETAFVTSETVSAAQAVTAAAIPTVTEIPVQQAQNTVTTVNPDYEDQCYDIINMEEDYSITLKK